MSVRPESKAMWDGLPGKTIGGALDAAVERYGDEVGYVFASGELTYNRLRQTSDLVARGLLRLGVTKGDKVAIWMAGYAEWAFVYFALARIGAIMVPVNTRYRPDEIKYVLNKSKASLLVFKEEANKDFVGLLKQLFPGGTFAGNLPNETLPSLRALIAASDRCIDGCLGFDELIAAGKAASEKELIQAASEVTGDDIAMLQFTSGTTAMPKAAMLFHSAMLRGAWCGCEVLQLTEADRFFSPQPFFHVGGSIQVMLTPILSGCRMIVQPYFDAGQALELMERHRCNVLMGHQPHYIEYLNHPDLKTRNLVLEKGMIFASADVNKRVFDEMGIKKLISPYGLTETHIGGTACALDDPLELRMTTVGRPMPAVEIGIRQPNGKEFLPAGERGEVCFRGWCVTKGYFEDPGKNAETLDEQGWFRTGDLGVFGKDGYLRLVGRIKEMIRVGGENVAAAEIESVLLEHHAVKQAVAVGMADPRLAEVVAVFVELKTEKQATEQDLIDFCRRRLASFKGPRRVEIVHVWPMTGAGKIQRFVLKESLVQQSSAKA
ncbi:MAG TPA: AMP-binding protein [Candidatus Binatia bacterium]|nr:AMP-binding protein [Candidatus Binatia bacterium]